jgi:hypothetical protein
VLHPPYFATSHHHFFFNAWSWDPYGEAFVPVNLNPVFDPYWGWSGVGGIWWERAYATSYGYGRSRYGYYPYYYAAADRYTATVDPSTRTVVLPDPAQETIQTPEQANDEMTDLLIPEYREDAFDDVYDALLLNAVDTTLETRSWYTETLDPVRILRSYHGFDRESAPVNLFHYD